MKPALAVVLPIVLAELLAQAPAPKPVAPVDRLLVCNKAANTMSIFDVRTRRELAEVETGIGPHEVAIAPDGRTAVVSDYGAQQPGSTLTIVDVERGAVVGKIVLQRTDVDDQNRRFLRPHGIRFVSATRVLVTSEATQRLLLVDVETREVVRTWSTPQRTMHMVALTSDGKHAAATSVHNGNVALFDLTVDAAATTPPTIFATGEGAEGLAIDPRTGAVWVANRAANTLTIVKDGAASAPIDTADLPFRIAFTTDGRSALVACAEGGEVQVFDAASQTLRHSIHITRDGSEVSALPMGLCVDPEDHFAYVACGRGEFVAVLDLRQRSVVDRLPAHAGPDGIGYARFVPTGLPRVLASCDDLQPEVTVAAHGSRLAAITASGRVNVFDSDSASFAEVPDVEGARATAIGNRDEPLWVATAAGIFVVEAGNAAHALAGADKQVDGLCLQGQQLAWWSTAQKRGGVLDAKLGTSLLALDHLAPGRAAGAGRVQFDRQGQFAICVHEGSPSDAVRWHRLAGGEVAGTTSCYASQRSPGFVVGPEFVVVAERVDAQRWRIDRLQFADGSRTTIDGDVRGGHFIDLFLSPSGRFLIEGDFEEPGLRCYDLMARAAAPRAIVAESEAAFAGFCVAADGSEVVATTRREGAQLELWPLVASAPVPSALQALANGPGDGLSTFASGRLAWRRSAHGGAQRRWRLEVLALPLP